MTVFRFDDPDQYVHGTPFAEFARLRREAPFACHEASQTRGDPPAERGFRLGQVAGGQHLVHQRSSGSGTGEISYQIRMNRCGNKVC